MGSWVHGFMSRVEKERSDQSLGKSACGHFRFSFSFRFRHLIFTTQAKGHPFFRSSPKGGRYGNLAFSRVRCWAREDSPFGASASSLLTLSLLVAPLLPWISPSPSPSPSPSSRRWGSHTTTLSAYANPEQGENPSRCYNRPTPGVQSPWFFREGWHLGPMPENYRNSAHEKGGGDH